MQVDTNEGSGEHDELMRWLSDNKLLKAKQQFLEYDVSMDDLKSIDLQNDLKLGGTYKCWCARIIFFYKLYIVNLLRLI